MVYVNNIVYKTFYKNYDKVRRPQMGIELRSVVTGAVNIYIYMYLNRN